MDDYRWGHRRFADGMLVDEEYPKVVGRAPIGIHRRPFGVSLLSAATVATSDFLKAMLA
jgi:hypothetical protein